MDDENVPDHLTDPIDIPPDNQIAPGPMEVLIVSYWKDFEWAKIAVRCINQFLAGHQGITIACPSRDEHLFKTLGCRLHTYTEVEGKGMVQHMAVMGCADLIVPHGTKYVMHLDSDCWFCMPTTAAHYFSDGKPIYLIRSYDSLTEDHSTRRVRKVVHSCHQWKEPTERQLGIPVHWYTMCRHPSVFPIEFYEPYRKHIEKTHNSDFTAWFLVGKNEWPQNRMDFTAMGAWAHHFMRDSFSWVDLSNQPNPMNRLRQHWSHGGITPAIAADLATFLK